MAVKSLATWRKNTLGQKIDLDNGSLDCVDVPKSWAEYLIGLPWQQSFCWGNAKDLYYNAPDAYWERIPRGVMPEPGWVGVMGSSIGGGYGHTFVVIAIIGNDMIVYEADTFRQVPVYEGRYSWNSGHLTGFLKPKVAFEIGDQPMQTFQRQVGGEVMNYRDGANRNAAIIDKFQPGEILDFKGYVKGESVENNNIWFVGKYTGGYVWSGGFTNTSTDGLEDLSPKDLAANERRVGVDAMNLRKAPLIEPGNVIRLINPGAVVKLTGYKTGMTVDGNNIWFQEEAGGFIHSSGFENSSVSGLTNLDPPVVTPPVVTPPVVTPPTTPVDDPTITQVVNKKNPIGATYVPADLTLVGNGQSLRSAAMNSFIMMAKDSSLAGMPITASSGFRSYATQETIYNNYVKQDGQEKADTYSARPGFSEHQTGLAIDITGGGAGIEEAFANTGQYTWLTQNAHKYGFILRYPLGKEAITGYMYEPWHWRYVGVDAAMKIQASGKTMEEYFNIAGGDYVSTAPPIVTPPVVVPPVVTPPVSSDDKQRRIESMKTVGRNGILGAVSFLILAVADWALMQLAGLHLPEQILIGIGGLVYAGLLYLDKWLHEHPKIKLKGLVPF